MKDITPKHLRCTIGLCPSVHDDGNGNYVIVGKLASGEGEAAIVISKEFFSELGRLREALVGIAKQRLYAEMSEEDQLNADWTEGYQECVKRARAALEGE